MREQRGNRVYVNDKYAGARAGAKTDVTATKAKLTPQQMPALSSASVALPNELKSKPDAAFAKIGHDTLIASVCGGGKNKHPNCKDNTRAGVNCADSEAGRASMSKLCSAASRVEQQVQEASKLEHKAGKSSCSSNGYTPCTFYSQQFEDSTLFEMYFKDLKGGVYLELGALDGVTYSNTKFFQETLGWGGVLIEASTPSFNGLSTNRASPKNTLFHNAVCGEPHMVTFSGTDAEAGILDTHMAGGRSGQGSTTVMCERMSTLLKKAKVTHIDLWSLDVEGGELEVLKSMDWDIPVHVMIIERNANDLLIEPYLLERGFRYVREQRGNRVYVNDKYAGAKASKSSAVPIVLTAMVSDGALSPNAIVVEAVPITQ